MKTAEEKAEMLRQQVIAKVRWGAGDQEVLDWLQDRQGITKTAANGLLADARRAKRAAVRKKALVYLIFSIPGTVLACFLIVIQMKGNVVIARYGPVITGPLCFSCIGVFTRSLVQLFTGHTEGSVD
jgi:hypothetical protein